VVQYYVDLSRLAHLYAHTYGAETVNNPLNWVSWLSWLS